MIGTPFDKSLDPVNRDPGFRQIFERVCSLLSIPSNAYGSKSSGFGIWYYTAKKFTVRAESSDLQNGVPAAQPLIRTAVFSLMKQSMNGFCIDTAYLLLLCQPCIQLLLIIINDSLNTCGFEFLQHVVKQRRIGSSALKSGFVLGQYI